MNSRRSEHFDVGCVVTMQYVAPQPLKPNSTHCRGSVARNSVSSISKKKEDTLQSNTKPMTTLSPAINTSNARKVITPQEKCTQTAALLKNPTLSSTNLVKSNPPKPVRNPTTTEFKSSTPGKLSSTKENYAASPKRDTCSHKTNISSPKRDSVSECDGLEKMRHSSDSLGAFYRTPPVKKSDSTTRILLHATCSSRKLKESPCEAAARILQLKDFSKQKTDDSTKSDRRRSDPRSETSTVQQSASPRDLLRIPTDSKRSAAVGCIKAV